MADFKGAQEMYVDQLRVFTGAKPTDAIVIHKTAGFHTAQDVAAYFAVTPLMTSSHYVVGLDGDVVQCVREDDGAAANCCLETGHDGYWDKFGGRNLNLFTISIEHVDPALDNGTPLTAAQRSASFTLVADICKRHGITSERIKTHQSIAPGSRARCPGNYPLDELRSFIASEGKISVTKGTPLGWYDDGTTLTSPDGVRVVLGFRTFILNNKWDHTDTPLREETKCAPLEASNPNIGNGQEQLFRMSRLCWREDTNAVYKSWIGAELDFWRTKGEPANPGQSV